MKNLFLRSSAPALRRSEARLGGGRAPPPAAYIVTQIVSKRKSDPPLFILPCRFFGPGGPLGRLTVYHISRIMPQSGFDYSEDYCCTLNNRTYGKKPEVEIRGLEAKPGIYGLEAKPGIYGLELLTNDPTLSGIYQNELAGSGAGVQLFNE